MIRRTVIHAPVPDRLRTGNWRSRRSVDGVLPHATSREAGCRIGARQGAESARGRVQSRREAGCRIRARQGAESARGIVQNPREAGCRIRTRQGAESARDRVQNPHETGCRIGERDFDATRPVPADVTRGPTLPRVPFLCLLHKKNTKSWSKFWMVLENFQSNSWKL